MVSDIKKRYLSSLLLLVGYTNLICAGFTQRRPQNGARLGRCSRTPLASSMNDFGVSLTNVLDDTGNMFMSPFSIYTALAMTYLGARGRTAQQIEDAFHLQPNRIDESELHNIMRDVLQIIREGHDEYNVSVANGLFVDQYFNVKPTYTDTVRNLYHGAVETVDFSHEGEAAKDKINAFVSENTNNKIPEFLEGPLSPATHMALLNAIYFKGRWEKVFPGSSPDSFEIRENEFKSVGAFLIQLNTISK